jgi:hypothetical protein
MIRVARFALALVVVGSVSASAQLTRTHEIREFFDLLDAAVRRRDRPAIERLYGPEFVFVLGNTGIVSRKAQIDAMMLRDPAKSLLSQTPLEGLRFYGEVAQLRIQNAAVFSVTTFIRRAGRWQIVLTQTNLLPAAAPAPAPTPPRGPIRP